MNERKRCPVCDTEIPSDADTCSVCGMDDLNRIFLDKKSYERWVETKLKPFTSCYRHNKAVADGGSQENVFPLKYDPYSQIRSVIAAGWSPHTVGLKRDGTVIAVGNNRYWQCEVGNWRDIVAIATGIQHTVGLKKDGTVVAVGWNGVGQCDVDDWRDIVAIAAGHNHTVGLKKDGTLVAVGDNRFHQCDVGKYTTSLELSGLKTIEQTPWKLF